MIYRSSVLILLALFSCSFNSGAAQENSVERGRGLLTRGNYSEAATVFAAVLEENPSDKEARLGLLRALTETGQYAESEKQAMRFLESSSDAAIRLLLAEIKHLTGRYADAATEFEQVAASSQSPEARRALLGRARALLSQGKEDEARASLMTLVNRFTSEPPASAEDLTLLARAVHLLERYSEANDFFIDARQADRRLLDAYIGQGELLNEKYNYGEAGSLFEDALKLNSNSTAALVGLAESKRVSSTAEAVAILDRALSVNSNHAEALAMRAWLDLESEQVESATRFLERALAVNPNSTGAMAVRASLFYVSDRKPELDAETKRALEVNPKAGRFFATLAHFAVINRRYFDAVEFGRRAVDLSPRLWSARTELGIQLLRVGRMAEGRQQLERAFEGDPFNVWAKNTLDLLDSMADYRDTLRGPFIIRAAPEESDAIAGYAADLLEDAHGRLTAKYRFTPRVPISVELFQNHDDFAVRSLGLPGLGALGVCFGQVIAMDSPAARERGQFNWGSTLWHEYMHVITLQMTEYRIPRWFSEGLSVFEERRARPGWGDRWSVERLRAFADGRFVKMTDLDAAFTRPKAPDSVPLAYFQASMVCEFIEEKHGFDALLKMLEYYRQGLATPEVFQRALSRSLEGFDIAFIEYMRSVTAKHVDAIGSGPVKVQGGQPASKEALIALAQSRPDDFFINLQLGSLYRAENDLEKAIPHLRKAAELFPNYAGEANPHLQLAEIYEAKGQKREAIAALETLVSVNDTSLDANKRLARLKAETGDKSGALQELVTSFYIHPFDAALHKLAGDLYLEIGKAAEAEHEYRVVVALDPPNIAEARYDLARSLEARGKLADARREVLRALEAAPGFELAQELLLRVRGRTRNP